MTADFNLISEWQIHASVVEVYDAITHCLEWPAWWKGVQKVEKLASGTAEGVGSIYRFTLKGPIPYRLRFDMRITKAVPYSFIEGQASGDVAGTGRWYFASKKGVTMARHEWQIHIQQRWMRLITNVAHPIVKWNHHQVMKQGSEGLAHWLGASCKDVDC